MSPQGSTGAAAEETGVLQRTLQHNPPFDALPPVVRDELAGAASITEFAPGELVLDAFADPSTEVFVVLAGRVDLWNDAARFDEPAAERLGVGGVFGFSSMLTHRPIGPRAIAARRASVAAIPASVVEPAFATRPGARFLAEQGTVPRARTAPPLYSLVDELIVTDPLVVAPDDPVADVARRMTERGVPCAVVPLGKGRFGLVTDAMLRRRVVVEGLPGSAPASAVTDTAVPVARLGDSAAEALILMLDSAAEFVLVVDRAGALRGVVSPRDFAVSPTTAGVSLHERVRRASTVAELQQHARRVPALLNDLLIRELPSGKVIGVYSSILDSIVRRALVLVFQRHEELSLDTFTWLALGSNGRREAVLSSDIDSAAAFDNACTAADIEPYRAAFAQVDGLLANSGMVSDEHGATAAHGAFTRTNTEWRAAAQDWLAAPEEQQGAIMTSLLVDGRPIHGDPGLPAVTAVFADVRRHPGTMRLLMQESLSKRAKLRSMRDIFSRRDTFDLKTQALLPIVNLARWAALSVGSAALPTTERLRAAAGSAMLPDEQAQNVIEAFEVLQRLRLRYQLFQFQAGERPSDLLSRNWMSPIDRSMVDQAIREVASVQRRMDNLAAYLPSSEWSG